LHQICSDLLPGEISSRWTVDRQLVLLELEKEEELKAKKQLHGCSSDHFLKNPTVLRFFPNRCRKP